MAQQEAKSNENTYLIDAESAVEMARLLDQDKLMTKGMGGIFSERDEELPGVSKILDIACGPGGWVFDVARTYPDIEVVGMDISKIAINYARAQAQLLKLENARFEVMDALKPLAFPDESFDIVNMRTIFAFVLPESWPSFLQECKRILRPGGTIRITEGEWGFTNKKHVELILFKQAQAMHMLKRTFSPNGFHFGLTPVLRPLLQQAGFEQVQMKAHAVDSSYGTEAYEATMQDFKLLLDLSRPFLLHSGVTTEQELDTIAQHVLTEMQEEDFYILSYLLTIWGVKM